MVVTLVSIGATLAKVSLVVLSREICTSEPEAVVVMPPLAAPLMPKLEFVLRFF